MASLTTGLIENTRVSGIQPCSTVSVTVTNKELIANTIRVNGYYWNGEIKKEYVLDLLTLAPGEVVIQNYYALFEAFEFHFISSLDDVEITVLGKNDAGRSTMKYNILPAQLFPLDNGGMTVEVPKTSIPSALNRVYLLDPCSRRISVIDGNTHTLIGSIIVGSGSFGVGINPVTNLIYVANFASGSVSAIDGSTNQVITEITVGSNPMGVGVNPQTNRIYVTNWGSHSVSVIDGLTHIVITTVRVEAFPEGVNVNQTANLIYITNHDSNNVTVLDGSTNTIKTMVDLGC
ncbi:YVTN family beta-propeller repeat protein [Desulfosporosinus sp. HMP52]|uniref:YncE family protein n=1 Tax=Desulfosporosinus sp. HMP52 TaxID=1487923 RepID=UPI00051FCA09|nr:YncE family protein [Desulfosporosinus sp. HMP52]KGK85753.1 YVTN family beta-propeller repeat protein [Desulfosporosinus sp. HMP52]